MVLNRPTGQMAAQGIQVRRQLGASCPGAGSPGRFCSTASVGKAPAMDQVSLGLLGAQPCGGQGLRGMGRGRDRFQASPSSPPLVGWSQAPGSPVSTTPPMAQGHLLSYFLFLVNQKPVSKQLIRSLVSPKTHPCSLGRGLGFLLGFPSLERRGVAAPGCETNPHPCCRVGSQLGHRCHQVNVL